MTSRRPNSRRAHRAAAVFLWIGGWAISSGNPAPYGLALGVVGLVYLGDSAPEQRFALASPPPQAPRHLTASSGPSCPLPVGQQVKAVKAFAEMLPVFRHARCLNCHGGVDPFEEDDVGTHEGGQMQKSFPVDLEQCQDCHSGLKGWMVPPREDLLFVGKSDEELCLQMKHHEKTGKDFVGHIFNDHDSSNVQFIAAGFKGDRALSEDFELKAEKPPGTQAELTEKARKWVDMLGKGYTASHECGCVMPKIKLEIDHTMRFEVPKGLPSKEESQVRFEMKLEPTGDPRINMFAGEHRLNREIKMTLPPNCKGKASRQERWMVYALVDSVTGSIKVRHTAFDDEPEGEIVCSQGRGTATMGIFPGHVSLVAWEAVIPADSGSSKTLRAEAVGRKEALTITVLEVPESE